MDKEGGMTIVCYPHTMVQGSYTISNKDGRLCLNSWKNFMDKEPTLGVGVKMLFLMYQDYYKGAYLFVTHFPDDVL